MWCMYQCDQCEDYQCEKTGGGRWTPVASLVLFKISQNISLIKQLIFPGTPNIQFWNIAAVV